MSNASRGSYYKARSKRWLIARGWQVADMEIVRWIYRPGHPQMPVKRDQFASDLLAVSADAVVFIQVKGGESARGGTFPAARRAFAAFTFPAFVEQWVMAWAPRAREPRIVQVEGDTYGEARQEQTKRPRLTLDEESESTRA
jgi:hypothetical protein